MKKLTVFLLSVLLLLSGCAKTEYSENPYRAVSYKSETIENGVVTFLDLAEYE